MKSSYMSLLEDIRQAFPQPFSNRFHDAYVVFSILRALDQVDQLKSDTPFLGTPHPLDFTTVGGQRIADDPRTVESVIPELVSRLQGMYIWAHPRAQINVVPPPSIASIIGVLLAAIYNPNLCSEEGSRSCALVESEVRSMVSSLVGYDPGGSGGMFTFGGTGANLYAVKIGLEKALPGTLRNGLRSPAVLVASDQSHYCRTTIAGWLGMGEEAVRLVPTDLDNAIRLDCLEETLQREIEAGTRIAAILATLGTTDAFGLDDLGRIVELRDRLVEKYHLDYRPHVHADAVIGWAWSVFADYPFEENPLGFRPRTVRSLAKATRAVAELGRADSIAIDFHKTGFVPYTSTLFLVRERDDLDRIARDRATMPYLYHTGQYHPGQFTLETSRPGTGPLAALANLLLLGKNGMRALLGHLVAMADLLREEIEGHSATTVLNGANVGTVTLFRAYPQGVDTFTIKERERTDSDFVPLVREYNEFNRRIFDWLAEDAQTGEGVLLSRTDCYRTTDTGEPIVALKSYMLSPFVDEASVHQVVQKFLTARRAIEAERDWSIP